MGRTIESLVVEFDQAKYEEFLSSGSKSPRARQYRRASSGICSHVPLEASSDATGAKSVAIVHNAREARVNVSSEIREAGVVKGQFGHALALLRLQVTRGSQQPMKRNRNVERRQRHRAHRQQIKRA